MLVDSLVCLLRDRYPNGCVIGITGRGAAGKTTLSRALSHRLNQSFSGHFCLDRYILPHYVRYNLVDKAGIMMTGYHPDTFNYNAAERDVANFIFNNGSVNTQSRMYDNCNSIKYRVIEGVASMHGNLNKLYDVTLFLECSLASETARRYTRKDDRERINYIADKKEELYAARKLHYSKYILPHKQKSDISLWSDRNYVLKIARANSMLLRHITEPKGAAWI